MRSPARTHTAACAAAHQLRRHTRQPAWHLRLVTSGRRLRRACAADASRQQHWVRLRLKATLPPRPCAPAAAPTHPAPTQRQAAQKGAAMRAVQQRSSHWLRQCCITASDSPPERSNSRRCKHTATSGRHRIQTTKARAAAPAGDTGRAPAAPAAAGDAGCCGRAAAHQAGMQPWPCMPAARARAAAAADACATRPPPAARGWCGLRRPARTNGAPWHAWDPPIPL
jgi:hypothetical protein